MIDITIEYKKRNKTPLPWWITVPTNCIHREVKIKTPKGDRTIVATKNNNTPWHLIP